MSDSWSWGAPPFYALIRGPFGRAGYQVATLVEEEDFSNKIVLLFSSREKALAHGQLKPQGHEDWKVGDLPGWKRLHFFLESMKPTASRICLDFELEKGRHNVTFPLVDLLPDLAEKAAAGSSGTCGRDNDP